jgi:hypothetical protein
MVDKQPIPQPINVRDADTLKKFQMLGKSLRPGDLLERY